MKVRPYRSTSPRIWPKIFSKKSRLISLLKWNFRCINETVFSNCVRWRKRIVCHIANVSARYLLDAILQYPSVRSSNLVLPIRIAIVIGSYLIRIREGSFICVYLRVRGYDVAHNPFLIRSSLYFAEGFPIWYTTLWYRVF